MTVTVMRKTFKKIRPTVLIIGRTEFLLIKHLESLKRDFC